MGYDWESGWRSGQHPRLTPLRPGFDPGLVRELWLVDLNLTPRVFLRVYRCSSLGKNQPLRQVVSSSVWITRLWLGRLVTTPNVPTLNKSYFFFMIHSNVLDSLEGLRPKRWTFSTISLLFTVFQRKQGPEQRRTTPILSTNQGALYPHSPVGLVRTYLYEDWVLWLCGR